MKEERVEKVGRKEQREEGRCGREVQEGGRKVQEGGRKV